MPVSREQLERDEAAERTEGDVPEPAPETTELPGDEPEPNDAAVAQR